MNEGLNPAPLADESLAQWWTTLHDPVLESLIQRAIQGNLDLRRAEAAVREARARRGIANTERFPTVTASALAGFSRGSNRMGTAADLGLFSTRFDAGWELDVFGRVRRSIEVADANLEASQEFVRDVLVSLLAEVAINYVEVRQFQTQLTIAEDNLRIQEDSLRLARERYNAGLTARLDVEQAEYSVAGSRSRIPTLRINMEQAKNRLAVLLGANPGVLSGELALAGKIPVGPAQMAVGVPADMLRRRPDVRRAERVLGGSNGGCRCCDGGAVSPVLPVRKHRLRGHHQGESSIARKPDRVDRGERPLHGFRRGTHPPGDRGAKCASGTGPDRLRVLDPLRP